MYLLEVVAIGLVTYIATYVVYHLLLLSVHFVPTYKASITNPPNTRFAVIIPAHNEELLLPRLLTTIKLQHYPFHLFNTIVVADNCTDSTARIASENGAILFERTDNTKVGKGYALKWAFDRMDLHDVDAVLVVDADSIIDKDALRELDQCLAEGHTIIQCYNGVLNPDDSWFTGLLDVSRTIGNEIYHPAKHRLGLSSYLMGNGMCFSKAVLMKYGWEAFSVGEDWEYYAKIIRQGERVAFGRMARILHQESSRLKQATSQRLRWAGGRFRIAWQYGFGLLLCGLKDRNIIQIDGSLPLLLPNPSLGVNLSLVTLAIVYLSREGSGTRTALLSVVAWLIAIQLGMFLVGIYYTRNRLKKVLCLSTAPVFLVWKMIIDIASVISGSRPWVRTKRRL